MGIERHAAAIATPTEYHQHQQYRLWHVAGFLPRAQTAGPS